MTRKIARTMLLLLCLGFGFLQGDVLQYEQQIIEKIEIEPVNLPADSDFDASSILSRIKTRKGALFSQTDFDNDLKTLIQEFDRIEPSIASEGGKLYILLKIWPRPTIRSITWNGNCGVDTKSLQKELGIGTCSLFDRQSFNKSFHKLKAYYVKEGYFEAALDYDVILDSTTNTVDISILINEGRAGRIKKIVFINFAPDEECELLESMHTKEYSFFTSWYTGTGTYNEEAMQQDRFDILRFLQNQGFADANVQISVEEAAQQHRIVITITAERGEVYNFGNITFEGNKLFCDDEIKALLQVQCGNSYSPDAIRDTVQKITDFYGRRGYIDAIIDYEQTLDCETRTYKVHFTIEEGEEYRVGLIKVFGNCTTETRVILHETLLTPGDIFNTFRLELTEERLENIGYFKHVNVYAVKSEGPGGLGHSYRDVHIEVEETTTGNFGAGFGVSTAESVFGDFRITERNFNHEGLFSFWRDGYQSLRGGGEFASFNVMIGAKSRKYTLSWTKPFFRDTPWVVGFDIENSNNRYISKDYEINATGITLHGSYPINQFIRFGTHYRLRNTYITLDKHRIHKEELENLVDAGSDLAEGDVSGARKHLHTYRNMVCKLTEEARNMGLISAAGITLSYDSTDNPYFPRRGYKSRVEQELAGFGGDHTFMSMAYLNSYYIPMKVHDSIRLKWDMRFIVPLFDTKRTHIPIDERLFLGGENTIRGYRVYRLGPQFNTGDPRGGMSMQLLSAQYNHPLGKKANLFFFADSGHLSFDVWNFGTMWTSVGFGINLKIMENGPPIVLGLGFPLNPDRRSDVQRFFFNMGGSF